MLQPSRRVSGRQITIMVVAICAAVVLAPAGVLAASHSDVSIADAKHPSHTATVTSKGAQVVSGSVRLTGTSKITGTVKNARGLPGTPYVLVGKAGPASGGGSPQKVPAGKHLVVTTVNVTVYDSVKGAQVSLGVGYDHTRNITVPLLDQGFFLAAQEEYANLLPVNLVVNPGTSLDVGDVATSGVVNATVEFIGYLV
jgi:hypothetical protein